MALSILQSVLTFAASNAALVVLSRHEVGREGKDFCLSLLSADPGAVRWSNQRSARCSFVLEEPFRTSSYTIHPFRGWVYL
jgi:hypothetical protein